MKKNFSDLPFSWRVFGTIMSPIAVFVITVVIAFLGLTLTVVLPLWLIIKPKTFTWDEKSLPPTHGVSHDY